MFIRRLYLKRYCKCFIFIFIVIIFWSVLGYLVSYDDDTFPDDVAYDIFIDETEEGHEHIPLDQEIHEELQRSRTKKPSLQSQLEVETSNVTDPIILWWTEFTGKPGQARSCGRDRCFFTNNRNFRNHKMMKVFVFYGTDFSPKDLPLPRHQQHEWALFHEESPKNNLILCHEEAISLFNYTSTFRRESDFPITTQHLPSLQWLEQTTFVKSTSQKNRYQEKDGLASVVYVQSDCDPPSDRDSFVKLLMKFIPVDSYGSCLNNKKLPLKLQSPIEGMAHREFYELMSHYKFALAMENAVCPDYITEKLWRPLMVGAVPIVFGSPSVKDFLPNNDSALLVGDFQTAEQLASHIEFLNHHDMRYDKLLSWKSEGVSNPRLRNIVSSRTWSHSDNGEIWTPDQLNFIDAFECFICNRVHDNMRRQSQGDKVVPQAADSLHYGCPMPLKFDTSGQYMKAPHQSDQWSLVWKKEKQSAAALKDCISRGIPYCGDSSRNMVLKKDF